MTFQAEMTCGQPVPDLRSPDQVMTLSRLGAFFPHRLSFMRVFLRRAAAEGAGLTVPVCQLDQDGFGHMVLCLPVGGQLFSLIAYSRPLDAADRTDRVIATKWDASFCLFEGMPTSADIAALSDQVTHQEAGLYHDRVLTLSRANKSVRLFAHIVDQLAAGHQPDLDKLKATGYLMRTTAVYGNGKFGIADRDKVTGYEGLAGPFQAEMLTVFLIREFTLLLAEYCARQKGGDKAVRLTAPIRRYIGVGNSTGLGMAPFLVNHPCLIHSWIMAREVALARALAVSTLSDQQQARLNDLLDRAAAHIAQWVVDDADQMARNHQLSAELDDLRAGLAEQPLAEQAPLADLFSRVQPCSEDAQELMVSVLLELIPSQVDGLAECMATPSTPKLDPGMSVSDLTAIMDQHYRWTQAVNRSDPAAQAQFWYVSEEKLEPRLGNRYDEPGAEREMPFNIALYVDQLRQALLQADPAMSVAEFLMQRPELRHIVRRVQTTARYPYGEIRDNLVGEACRPIDLLRCKLSFFGASKFDPKSDRWTRITLYQGAPTADDLTGSDKASLDDWLFPLHPA